MSKEAEKVLEYMAASNYRLAVNSQSMLQSLSELVKFHIRQAEDVMDTPGMMAWAVVVSHLFSLKSAFAAAGELSVRRYPELEGKSLEEVEAMLSEVQDDIDAILSGPKEDREEGEEDEQQ